jgi:nicotinamidase-related amidase
MSLVLDPRNTALVLIDLQAGILSQPLAPHDSATVTKNAVALARRFLEKSAPVVAVTVTFSADYGDTPPRDVDSPMQLPPGGIPAGWADLVAGIDGLSSILRVTKRQWGAFFGTELDLQLRRRGIATIVLAGVSTPIGVEQTAREAWQHNYNVVVAEDACSAGGGDVSIHEHSIRKIMPRIARIRSTGEILAALGSQVRSAP